MKAKKGIVLAAVMALILAVSGTALAIPSPTGSTVVGKSANVSNIQVRSISAVKQESLTQAAQTYITGQFGAEYQASVLLALDLIVTRTDNNPVTIVLNVAGVKPGDTVLASHEKTDGTVEIVPARVLSAGVVELTLRTLSPVAIIRVASKGEGGSPSMPKTGDNATAAPMAMLLTACTLTLLLCVNALKKGSQKNALR